MNLSKLIERGEDLQSFELVRRTHNYGVVATIPADVGPGEDPDMIIVVSAHMDSQGLNSPGASDNSSGTVVAVDMGRHLIELTNEDGVIPGNRIEIQLAPVGAHEGGGGTVSIAIANRILERGLGGVAINMNMDMVMSPSATAGGILMDAVSMDTWMPPTIPAPPGGDAGLRFNLPAYLVIGSIEGVAGDDRDPVLADGIVNARIFRFAGSEHVRFNEAPRLIEAASMIIVEDTTGTNDIGTFYHNAMDSMEFEYCYDRLSMSRDLYLRGILRAVEQEITKQARFTLQGDTLRLANATQIYQTFDRVAGEIVIDDTVIPFTINYPDVTVTNAALAGANASDIVFRNVMASGYGVADHRNTERLTAHPHLARFSTGMVARVELFSGTLRDALAAAEEALNIWNATTNWGAVGGVAGAIRDDALGAVIDAIPSNIRARWVGTPFVELGGVNIFDGPFFGSLLELSYVDSNGVTHTALLRSMFICDRRIEWNSTYYDNRNMFPADGVPRSDMERNVYELENNFGTSRAWGAPNIARVADYLESEFLDMGFARENVEIIRVDRRNRGLNPDGSNLAALTIPWIGSLTFDIPEEDDPILGTYNHYGPIHYGGMTLPGDGVTVAPEDWPFEAIEDVALVDIGIFPILSIPQGTTGDVIVAVRFVEANLNLTTQLAPALDALMESNPDVNIVGVVLARTGRVAWQRSLGGVTGGGTSPFPVIMSSCMNLSKLIEIREDLQSFELVRRTHNYGVVATIPADVGPGEDPDMIIVVSAHMDSQGLNSPGASDNSSGTVVAVDLGRRLLELTNDDGVIPGNRIEIQLAPVGAHEGGGGTVSIAIANRILERGLGGVAINMNMDMVMSPSATAGGILMDAVSMDTWMPPTPGLPGGDAGLRFNLPAYLVIGSITGVSGDTRDPILADGIVNARIFRFAGSEHVRFNEAPRLIEAASMIIVEDTTGTNDIGTFYHNAMDSMEFEYCYDRLSMSRDLYLRGILRAVEQEITKQARFILEGDTLRLANATQIYRTFDRVAGEIVIDDTVIPFTINYPGVTVTNAALEDANASDIVFRNVMASGYGVADHRNTGRLAANPHLNRFSTGMVADLYVQTVDRDDLRDIIEEAELLEREDFTAANWRLFLPALNHARNVYNNSDSTQAEVDQAINTLRNLINRSMRP
jgi:P pilus assembly chaperone PapD